MFKPRPMQQQVLDYQGGWMGVSAVPGSGKTQTLSYLAAQLIAESSIEEGQEVLVVTFANSAVNNFSLRIGQFVEAMGLIRNVGYRVRTLHGLAHDIVRERPGLVGLSDDFQIVDERDAGAILADAVDAWIRTHPDTLDDYIDPELDGWRERSVRQEHWPKLVKELAASFIQQAKDLKATPARVRHFLEQAQAPLPLVELGLEIYQDYQRGLAYRGAVDFADLIRLALQALHGDEDFVQRLRARWPFILEDEAQDSNHLQEELLRLLAGEDGNWVRVGDTNQAIYETFTAANPRYLREFLGVADSRPLLNSGRSTRSIIALANRLVEWTRAEHPVEALQDSLADTYIEETPPGDPQPNPPDDPARVQIIAAPYSPEKEVEAVAISVNAWLRAHPDQTAAILVPRNDRGVDFAQELKRRGIPYVEILRSTHSTREAAEALARSLAALGKPDSIKDLVLLYKAWPRGNAEDAEKRSRVERVAALLRKLPRVESFLWPRLEADWLESLNIAETAPQETAELVFLRETLRRWQTAVLLPVDQLLLTVAQDLFHEPADLALAYKLAGLLGGIAAQHPEWPLPRLADELSAIARNERKLLGFSDEDTGFDPDAYKGKVIVATMHKAKGLEWDRVYLTSANNYDFPSALPQDTFISEKWFVRDRRNLQSEMLLQLKALAAGDVLGWNVTPADASAQARLEYAAERLRLFYVGITRARKELTITWNNGRDHKQQEAAAFTALRAFWEPENDAAAR